MAFCVSRRACRPRLAALAVGSRAALRGFQGPAACEAGDGTGGEPPGPCAVCSLTSRHGHGKSHARAGRASFIRAATAAPIVDKAEPREGEVKPQSRNLNLGLARAAVLTFARPRCFLGMECHVGLAKHTVQCL